MRLKDYDYSQNEAYYITIRAKTQPYACDYFNFKGGTTQGSFPTIFELLQHYRDNGRLFCVPRLASEYAGHGNESGTAQGSFRN